MNSLSIKHWNNKHIQSSEKNAQDNSSNLRKKGIKDPLASQQGMISWQLLSDRPNLTYRPYLDHAKLFLYTFKFELQDNIL